MNGETQAGRERIEAPWTPEQVDALNRWQSCGWVHPYTCGGCSPSRILHAVPRGWVCAFCGHHQTWAHAGSLTLPPDPKTWLAIPQEDDDGE